MKSQSGMEDKETQSHIIVVEDDPDLREALVDTLSMAEFQVISAASAEVAIEVLNQRNDIGFIISDVNMGKLSGHDLLLHVKSYFPHIPMLLITAYASISESVQAMREGAIDYLVKPFEADVLVEAAKKYVGHCHSADEPIAVAESSKQLLQLACRFAQSDSTVLLLGESGTGKEVLARYIHNRSSRVEKPFVAINCAAIPENMLEAMLFGHEKGAYTGAYAAAPGKFEQANGGTLLLDEISEMDLGLQAKLLRVLQEREVERLGGRKSIQLDVRVIATSNRKMRQEVSDGKFREDLYFRLSVLPLFLAPLRDRPEDILPLAETLLSRHANKQHRNSTVISPDAENALLSYSWPGNVRELDNVMQRALILQSSSMINTADLGLMDHTCFSEKPSLVDAQNAVEAQNSVVTPQSAADIPVSFTIPSNDKLLLHSGTAEGLGSDLRRREFEIIVETLRKENGSKKKTAQRLGISPRTLRYKLAKLKEEGFELSASVS